jgi:hypothetical protein
VPVSPNIRYLLLLTMLFAPLPARAQPLFRCEHNWTFSIGERVYGLQQVVKTPGELRYTTIWFGRCCLDTRFREGELIALLFYPSANRIGAILRGVAWRSFRCPFD